MTSADAGRHDASAAQKALLLAAATVVVWVVLVATDHDGPLWLLQPLLGLVTAVTAWRAGGASPQNTRAFIALVVGSLAVLAFLGFVVTNI